MKKLTIFLLITFPTWIYAQYYSPAQQLVKSCLENAFVIVEQNYLLADSANNLFGKDNLPMFGTSTSIGFRTNVGIIIPDCIAHPWLYDADYERYRNDYRPVLSSFRYKNVLNDSSWISKDSISSHAVEEGSLYYWNDSISSTLSIDSISGKKNGWFVWLSVPDSGTLTNNIIYSIFSKEITLGDTIKEHPVNAPSDTDYPSHKTVLGGVYMTPFITTPGTIEFRLSAFMIKKQNEWVMISLASEAQSTCQELTTTEVLTPINKRNKNEKNK